VKREEIIGCGISLKNSSVRNEKRLYEKKNNLQGREKREIL